MKTKLMALLLLTTLALSLLACGGNPDTTTATPTTAPTPANTNAPEKPAVTQQPASTTDEWSTVIK